MTNPNTGNRNTGKRNTGNRNTGDYNAGSWNTGYWNTGSWNTGDWNTGNWNTGNWNTGNWNTGDWNTGFFMTTTPDVVPIFNGAAVVFFDFDFPGWFYKVNPTGHDGDMKEAWRAAWEASEQDVDEVLGLPGFDHDIWFEITGIDLSRPTVPETIVVDGRTYRLVDDDE